jgi:hypothetical protein
MNDMHTHKRWTLRLVIVCLLLLSLVGLAVFTIDPLQHFRRATFYRPWWGPQRYYDPGFVKHYDYDCIIIGSSMVENFIPSEVGRKLSRKVLLAPLRGFASYEEHVLLSAALRTGKVKAVIWGLDFYHFLGGARGAYMPYYLYDDNPLNDYQYLLNIDVLLKDCWRTLEANLLPRIAWRKELNPDSAHFWGDQFTFSRESTLKSWHDPRRGHPTQVATSKPRLDSMVDNFEANVMSLVERYPGVRYYFFYPPYSILYWVNADSSWLGTQMEFKRYLFRRIRELPNVRVFDFQDAGEITLDLDNYKDYTHFSPDVNKFIIDAISRNQYLVTGDNIEKGISRLEGQARMFTDSLDAAEVRQ